MAVVSCERVFVIHFESSKGCKNELKLHSKMSLVTLECKLAGFLVSSRFLVKFASNSEFILNKIKQAQSGADTEDFKKLLAKFPSVHQNKSCQLPLAGHSVDLEILRPQRCTTRWS